MTLDFMKFHTKVERLKVDLEPEPWDAFLNEYFRLNIEDLRNAFGFKKAIINR
jgi:hypothetical protein